MILGITRPANIPATTSLATLDPRHRVKALMVGVNVVMPDFTPAVYKSHYDIYPGGIPCNRISSTAAS